MYLTSFRQSDNRLLSAIASNKTREKVLVNLAREEFIHVTEFLLLECLASRPGHVKSRDQLMSSAYDDNIYVDDGSLAIIFVMNVKLMDFLHS